MFWLKNYFSVMHTYLEACFEHSKHILIHQKIITFLHSEKFVSLDQLHIETALNAFANTADPDQAALIRVYCLPTDICINGPDK